MTYSAGWFVRYCGFRLLLGGLSLPFLAGCGGNTPVTAEIDSTLSKNAAKMFVVGGSSLSPPEIPFNEKQPLSLSTPAAKTGMCDVGFRLAYTAPIDSIVDVLANAFKDPKYLPAH